MCSAREMIQVLKAYAKGKLIEEQAHGQSGWVINYNPTWDWSNYSYRVAPNFTDMATRTLRVSSNCHFYVQGQVWTCTSLKMDLSIGHKGTILFNVEREYP